MNINEMYDGTERKKKRREQDDYPCTTWLGMALACLFLTLPPFDSLSVLIGFPIVVNYLMKYDINL